MAEDLENLELKKSLAHCDYHIENGDDFVKEFWRMFKKALLDDNNTFVERMNEAEVNTRKVLSVVQSPTTDESTPTAKVRTII